MEKTRRSLFLGTISLLIVLGLLTGCYRPAASDVTETPAGGAEATLSDEEMLATAAAESTRVAQTGEESPTAELPTESPTV